MTRSGGLSNLRAPVQNILGRHAHAQMKDRKKVIVLKICDMYLQ